MFNQLDIDNYVDDIINSTVIERKKLHKSNVSIYKTIFTYCLENHIIISCSDLLIDPNHVENMLSYDLYTTKPLKHANNLLNLPALKALYEVM